MPINSASYSIPCYTPPVDGNPVGLWAGLLKDARELFREKLNVIMTMRGLTNRALALAVGVAPSVVTSWRKGVTSPEMQRLSAIANALSVPVHYFFVDSSEPIEIAARLRAQAERIASDARDLAEEATRMLESKGPKNPPV